MSFASDVAAFGEKALAREQRVFAGAVPAVKGSIVEGSPVTGAPGQPRVTGEMADSWQVVPESPTATLIVTAHPGAPAIEHGVRAGDPLDYHHGGGPHSVALTRAGWVPLVADVVRQVVPDA